MTNLPLSNPPDDDDGIVSNKPTICSLKSLEVVIPDDIRQHIAQQYRHQAGNNNNNNAYDDDCDGEEQEVRDDDDDCCCIVDQLLQAMKIPPNSTICRVNFINDQGSQQQQQQQQQQIHHHHEDSYRGEIQCKLEEELRCRRLDDLFFVEPHTEFPDVLCVLSKIITGTGEQKQEEGGGDNHRQLILRDLTKPPPEGEVEDDHEKSSLFPNWTSRRNIGWPMNHRVVIVDRFCGEAVLRGSSIFVKGIMCADRGIQPGDIVAIYADVRPTTTTTTTIRSNENKNNNNNNNTNKKAKQQQKQKQPKLKRGCFLEDYKNRLCVYLGMGESKLKRSDYFRLDKGVAIDTMILNNNNNNNNTSTAYRAGGVGPILPPISGILPKQLFFQNLPSIVVAHALDPQRGDVIIDMCSAPGGKTSHLASLVRNDATIVACDKSRKKMISAQTMFQQIGATCITPLALDSTNCVLTTNAAAAAAAAATTKNDDDDNSCRRRRQSVQEILESSTIANDGLLNVPGFFPETFDRVLLDPPCSALGLRPKLQIVQTSVKELQQVCMYQRKFVRQAEALLKPGGIMTYSTCTFIGDENECMVRYMLDEFPTLELVPILVANKPISVGNFGLKGLGLNERERSYVRRFDPLPDQGNDTIGFFVAKFRKKKS